MVDNLTTQPQNLNLLKEVNAHLTIDNIPNTTYLIQTSAIPGITLGEARYPTPVHDVPIPGDTLLWSPLVVSFLITEDLSNYIELFDWMTSLSGTPSKCLFDRSKPGGPSEGRSKLIPGRRVDTSSDIIPPSLSGMPGFSNPVSKITKISPPYGEYTDMTLNIMTNNMNPLMEIRFHDCFPNDLGQLDFTTATTEAGPIVGTVTFQYNYFSINKIGKEAFNKVK